MIRPSGIRYVRPDHTLMKLAGAMSTDATVRALSHSAPHMAVQMLEGAHHAEAMLDDGALIGIGGLTLHWPGRAEAWLMLTQLATMRHRAIALARCNDVMREAQQDYTHRRIEFYLPADASWRRCFAERLGFQFEGLAHAWCPLGRDWFLYARVARGKR